MQRLRLLVAPVWIAVVAVGLALVSGVGFANYDTLYALVWGEQIAHGNTPAYGLPIAPTPHPLIELLGVLLTPLGASASASILLVLGYVALATLSYLIFRLGNEWFAAPVGIVAAAVTITREPILNFGERAYIDIPYVVLVLGALLIEVRRPRAGWRVLALLTLAGLLRPEAWLIAGAYWLYLAAARPPRRVLAALAGLAVLAPALWIASDLVITGHPLWSLTKTRATTSALHRTTGLLNAPVQGVHNLASVLWYSGSLAAAAGLIGWLWLLRDRARLGVAVAALGMLAFAVFASSGLPLDTRYVFLPASLLAIFAGVGLFGWRSLPRDHPRRRQWQLVACALALITLVLLPAEVRLLERTKTYVTTLRRIDDDLASLTRHAISLRCGTIGVQYHQPIPLLALWLHTSPANVRAAAITSGEFVAAANEHVLKTYVLVKGDPGTVTRIPAGFVRSGGNSSWTLYERCGRSH